MERMLILASQSPRRRELLSNAGFRFEVRVAGVPEAPLPGEPPSEYVERLAVAKARAVPADAGDWVLAADTTVVCDEHILEKPQSPGDAARMLRLLSGRAHEVLTGFALRHQDHCWQGVESTRVVFALLSDREIAEYVASGEPMDKAGAYGIQGLASRFVTRIEGCYFNVVGLPVARVSELLARAGYRPDLG